MNKKLIEIMIRVHKKVDVNALSDAEWQQYKEDRREMEAALKKAERV
jgi:hypothetical protein